MTRERDYDTLIELLELVDPMRDHEEAHEIYARAWCFIKNIKYLSHEVKEYCFDIGGGYTELCIVSPLGTKVLMEPFDTGYLYSMDALLKIVPKDYDVSMFIANPVGCEAELMKAVGNKLIYPMETRFH